MEQLQKFYESSKFKELDSSIKNNEDILIVANKQNKKVESFYYAMWFKYCDRIEIFKYLFLNTDSKTSLRGKTNIDRTGLNKTEQLKQMKLDTCGFKQIVFILERNLKSDSVFIKRLKERKRFNIDSFASVPYLNMCPEKLISVENTFFNPNLLHNQRGDFLIFDTETNGLPLIKNFRCVKYDYDPIDNQNEFLPSISRSPYYQCRLLSIGWLVVDRKTFNIKKSYYHLIKDSSVKNSVSAQLVNKIPDEEREKHGITFKEVYEKLKEDLEKCGYIVCHGSDFDINVLCNEIKVHELSFDIIKNKCICNTKQNLFKEFNQHLSDLVKVPSTPNPVRVPCASEHVKVPNAHNSVKVPSTSNSVKIHNESSDVVNEPHNALYDAKLCNELFKIRIKD